MSNDSLQVVSVDYFADHSFVLYFSDDTYATLSARELADCVPDRKRVPEDRSLMIDGADAFL